VAVVVVVGLATRLVPGWHVVELEEHAETWAGSSRPRRATQAIGRCPSGRGTTGAWGTGG